MRQEKRGGGVCNGNMMIAVYKIHHVKLITTLILDCARYLK